MAAEREGDVAAAGGQVENGLRLPASDRPRHPAPPEEVEAATQEVVGQVIPPGYGAKEALDESGFLQCVEMETSIAVLFAAYSRICGANAAIR